MHGHARLPGATPRARDQSPHGVEETMAVVCRFPCHRSLDQLLHGVPTSYNVLFTLHGWDLSDCAAAAALQPVSLAATRQRSCTAASAV